MGVRAVATTTARRLVRFMLLFSEVGTGSKERWAGMAREDAYRGAMRSAPSSRIVSPLR
jgi:hypothetical protein